MNMLHSNTLSKTQCISCAYSVAEISSYDLSEDVPIEERAEHWPLQLLGPRKLLVLHQFHIDRVVAKFRFNIFSVWGTRLGDGGFIFLCLWLCRVLRHADWVQHNIIKHLPSCYSEWEAITFRSDNFAYPVPSRGWIWVPSNDTPRRKPLLSELIYTILSAAVGQFFLSCFLWKYFLKK